MRKPYTRKEKYKLKEFDKIPPIKYYQVAYYDIDLDGRIYCFDEDFYTLAERDLVLSHLKYADKFTRVFEIYEDGTEEELFKNEEETKC